jgi:hypothetical protein
MCPPLFSEGRRLHFARACFINGFGLMPDTYG